MERESMLEALSRIGILELSKMEFWRDDDEDETTRWNYEKRPFGRVHERPYKGTLMSWPSINISLGIVNPHHKPLGYTRPEEFKAASRQWSRFHVQLLPDISRESKDVILFYYRSFMHHWDLPDKIRTRGLVGRYAIDDDEVDVTLPPCSEEFFTVRHVDFLMSYFGSTVMMPLDDAPLKADRIGTGSQFHAMMTPLLSYLRSMDVVETKKLQALRLVEDCSRDELESLIQGRLRFSYSIVIFDMPPAWSLAELSQYVSSE
jgi:hypothetical protein